MRECSERLGRFKSCQGGVAKDQGTEMGTFSSELGTAAKSTEQLGSPERDRGQTVHIIGLCRICSGQEATELAKPTSGLCTVWAYSFGDGEVQVKS